MEMDDLGLIRVIVDLTRLIDNIALLRRVIGDRIKLLFAVKSDAYSHGAVAVADAATQAGVDFLGVTEIAEAKALRDAGVRLPILILTISKPKHIEPLVRLGARTTVTNIEFADALDREAKRQGKRVPIHVKVDTGMGRIGLFPEEVMPFFERLRRFRQLEVEGIFSHLSVSDSQAPDDIAYTRIQLEAFVRVLAELDRAGRLPPLRHIANSAAVLQYQDEVTSGYLNLVRPGTLLYGYPEVDRPWAREIKRVMRVETEVMAVRELPAGSYISYERLYQTESPTRIAVLPIGYANGLDRRLSNRGELGVRGRRIPIVGAVCMDLTMVDVSEVDGVRTGDRVEIIGDEIGADDLGETAGISLAQVLTALGQGGKRIYLDEKPGD
ncbi:MAG: alanine racemase [Candidatus Bipolaricaulia bacterium]